MPAAADQATRRCIRCGHRWPRKGRDTCGPCDRDALGRDTIPRIVHPTTPHGGARPGSGRPPRDGAAADHRLTLRLTPAELAAIDAARLAAGLTRSAFARRGAVELAERMLKKGR